MAFIVNHYELVQARPGMVLGRPVLNRHGKILLTEGTELSSTHIGKLLELGVKTVGFCWKKRAYSIIWTQLSKSGI